MAKEFILHTLDEYNAKLGHASGMKIHDITGHKYNSLTVVRFIGSLNNRGIWLCQCDCGEIAVTTSNQLRNNATKTCGVRKNHAKKWTKEKKLERLWKDISPEPNSGCWLWIGSSNKNGYGSIEFEGKAFLVHRLMYELTIGPIHSGLWACHKCDIPACCNPDHIYLGTPKDNSNDVWTRGRGNPRRGESHPMAKIDETDVIEIRRILKSGNEGPASVARRYGIGIESVRAIRDRKTWKHI